MMHKIIFFLFCFSFQIVAAQVGYNTTQGATALAVGNITSISNDDVPFWNNPAGLAKLNNWQAAASVENRFSMSPLSIVALGGALPTKSGNFGISIQNFGVDEYREQKMGLQFAKKLSSKFYLGVGFDVFRLQIQQYGTRNWLSLQLGTQFRVTEKLELGVRLQHPMAVRLSEYQLITPSLQVGAMYGINKNVKIMGELAQSVEESLRLKVGLDYRFLSSWAVQMGVQRSVRNDRLSSFCFGFAWKMGSKWRFSSGVSLQRGLGIVSAFTLQRGTL